MNQFYVLDYRGGTRGVPHFVDGVIDEWYASPWRDELPDAVEQYVDQTPMNLRTKHPLIDFDYGDVHSLFIASDVMLERLTGAACEYVSRPLRVWAAKNKECTQKTWFLIRVQNRYWCMEKERSEYKVAREKGTGNLKYSKLTPGQVVIDLVYKLVIDAEKTEGKDLFYCHEAHVHIVTDRLAQRMKGLLGARLTPAGDYKFPMHNEKVIDRG